MAPPGTDSGTVENVKWPFALSHNRMQAGGWARQQSMRDVPIATAMAGVDMRLNAGAIREMHWHLTTEWGYVMAVCYLAPALGVCGSALSINRGAVESTLWTNWVVTTWLKFGQVTFGTSRRVSRTRSKE